MIGEPLTEYFCTNSAECTGKAVGLFMDKFINVMITILLIYLPYFTARIKGIRTNFIANGCHVFFKGLLYGKRLDLLACSCKNSDNCFLSISVQVRNNLQ